MFLRTSKWAKSQQMSQQMPQQIPQQVQPSLPLNEGAVINQYDNKDISNEARFNRPMGGKIFRTIP